MKRVLALGGLGMLWAIPVLAQDSAALAEAVGWIRESNRVTAQYDYEMSVKIRLLIFWISKDSVGGGYIRLLEAPRSESSSAARLKSIEVLFGSDPAKTKGVNRWGAGTEVMRLAEPGGRDPESSAFLGFMKASKGDSAASMQAELNREKTNNQFLFDATVTRADRGRALARTTPFTSSEDYTFSQLERASQAGMDRLDKTDRPIQHSAGDCSRGAGFLSTVKELLDSAVDGRAAPLSLCYYFNARTYTATLKSWKPVEEATTRRPQITYRHLVRANFTVLNHADQKTTTFELLAPRDGPLKGTPVEIVHQPNWWFQIILSMKPQSAAASAP